jgi:hypothetical protein
LIRRGKVGRKMESESLQRKREGRGLGGKLRKVKEN